MKVYLDGDKWCAVHDNFVDLAVSPAGFGDTPQQAIADLIGEFDLVLLVEGESLNTQRAVLLDQTLYCPKCKKLTEETCDLCGGVAVEVQVFDVIKHESR